MSGFVIGIDPGITGALACLDREGIVVDVWPMPRRDEGKVRHPDGATLRRILTTWPVRLVAVEKVHAMPGQGVSTMFAFGCNWGYVLGVLVCMGLPYELVTPQAWQKAMFASQPKRKDIDIKKATRAFADRRWPQWSTNPGKADALCIAEWARRYLIGKGAA